MDYVSKQMFVNLTALHGARVIEEYDEDGHLERGVFIPLDRNGLFENDRKRVYLYAFINYDYSRPNQESYQIMQRVHSEVYEKLKELGYGRTLLGRIQPLKTKYPWRPYSEYVAQVISESKNKKK